jgi:hypothetical protein
MTKPDDTERDDPPVAKSKFEIAVEEMYQRIGPPPGSDDHEKPSRVKPTLH